jgi:hypothetical protein
MTILTIKNKEGSIALFMRNLLRGTVSMEYERFRCKQSPGLLGARFS